MKLVKSIFKGSNKVANAIVAIGLFLCLLLGCYVLWDTKIVHETSSAKKWNEYKPTGENKLSFEELQQINPDVVAWLDIYGTGVDFPVTYSTDSDYYLVHDALKKGSAVGSVFIDSGCSPDFSDFSTIIYGHRMQYGAMFGDLTKFLEHEFFDSHKYGDLYFSGTHHGLQIFEILEADAYDTSVYRTKVLTSESINYLQNLRSRCIYLRDVAVSPSDKIVLLSTCADLSTNNRYIVVAKISDEVFDDEFGEEINTGSGIDELGGLFGFPWIGWFSLLFVLLVIIILILRAIERHRNKKRLQ